jgi:hypothetical protein
MSDFLVYLRLLKGDKSDTNIFRIIIFGFLLFVIFFLLSLGFYLHYLGLIVSESHISPHKEGSIRVYLSLELV